MGKIHLKILAENWNFMANEWLQLGHSYVKKLRLIVFILDLF